MRGSVLIAYEEGKQTFGNPLYEITINGSDTRDYQWSEANSLYSTYIFSGNTLSVYISEYGYGQIPYINVSLSEYTNDAIGDDQGIKTTQLTGVTGNNYLGYLNLTNLPINPSANCYDFIVTVSAGLTQGCAPFGTLTGLTGSGSLYTTTSEVKTRNVGVQSVNVGDVYTGVFSQFTNTGYVATGSSQTQIGPIIRLSPTYGIDPGFNSKTALGTSITVNDIEIQNDGMILVGNGITGTSGNCLSRLTTSGALDGTFTRYTFTGSTGSDIVSDVVQQSDGKIIVSGRFTSVNGSTYNSYARFNYNGTIDNTYYSGGTATGFSALVNCEIDVRNDKVYFFGRSTFTFNGSEFGAILRLNTNGTLDTTFNGTGRGGFSRDGGATCIVNSINVLSNGQVLCVGGFTSYNGQYVRGVAMLNEDGTLDTTFNPGGYGLLGGSLLEVFPTETINEDENAYLIVGGWTGASYNQVAIPNGIFFINKDGSLGNNTNLGTGIVGTAKTAKLLPNGSYLITGEITSFNGTAITNGGFIQISSSGQLQNC
jgi:uncharacterized delta-60 repeat protein